MSKPTHGSIGSVTDADAKGAPSPSIAFHRRAPRSERHEARPGEPLTASSNLRSTCYIVVAGLLGLCLILFATSSRARAQEQDHYHPGHAEFHNIYKGWVQSNGFSSCCNGDDPDVGIKGDCRPARAYLDPDDDHWRVLIRGKWLVVPPEAVRPYSTPDGNSHVCEDESNGIMCFVGGKPKS